MWAAEDPACQPVCASGGEEAACAPSGVRAPAICCFALKENAQLAASRVAYPGKVRRVTVSVLGEQGGEGKRTGGSERGRVVGLAQVPHRRALAVELLRGTKSSPPLAAALPENPAERISFRTAPKLLLFCFMAEQNKSPGLRAGSCQGLPCPSAGCGAMWAATGWTVLCWAPTMEPQTRRGWR